MSDFQKFEEQKKLQFMEPEVNTIEEIDVHIQNFEAKEVSFEKETYKVIYNENQTEAITRDLLKSDKALEDYYQKHDASKLEGLRSKSFLNFPGKKSERKKLRKDYLNSIREKTTEYKVLDDYLIEEEEKKAKTKQKMPTYNTDNTEEIMREKRVDLIAEIKADFHDLELVDKYDGKKLNKMNFVQLSRYKKMLGSLTQKDKAKRDASFKDSADNIEKEINKLNNWHALVRERLRITGPEISEEEYNSIKDEIGFEDEEPITTTREDRIYFSDKLFVSLSRRSEELIKEQRDVLSETRQKYAPLELNAERYQEKTEKLNNLVTKVDQIKYPFEAYGKKVSAHQKEIKAQEALKAKEEELKAKEEAEKEQEQRAQDKEKALEEKKQWVQQVKDNIKKMASQPQLFDGWARMVSSKVKEAGLDPKKLEGLKKQYKIYVKEYDPDPEDIEDMKNYPEHLKEWGEFYYRIQNFQRKMLDKRTDTLNDIWKKINDGIKDDSYKNAFAYQEAKEKYEAASKQLDEAQDQFDFLFVNIQDEYSKYKSENMDKELTKIKELADGFAKETEDLETELNKLGDNVTSSKKAEFEAKFPNIANIELTDADREEMAEKNVSQYHAPGYELCYKVRHYYEQEQEKSSESLKKMYEDLKKSTTDEDLSKELESTYKEASNKMVLASHDPTVDFFERIDRKRWEFNESVENEELEQKKRREEREQQRREEQEKEQQRLREEEKLKQEREKETAVSEELVEESYRLTLDQIQIKGSNVMKKRAANESDQMEWDAEENQEVYDDECFKKEHKNKVKNLFKYANGNPEMSDVRQDGKRYNCWLVSTLAGLALTNPDYIKNELIRDVMETNEDGEMVPSKDYCVVKLYDVKQNVRYIRVAKTSTQFADNWSSLVMKAAMVLVGQGGRQSAGYRSEEEMDQEEHLRKLEDLDHGSEGLASSLLFGRAGLKVSTREKADGDDVFNGEPLHRGETAIGEMLAYIKAGNMVVSSTCKNIPHPDGRYHYHSDSVPFSNSNLHAEHAYLVLGEGEATKEGAKTIRIRDPYADRNDGIMDITYADFKRHFSDFTVMNSKEI